MEEHDRSRSQTSGESGECVNNRKRVKFWARSDRHSPLTTRQQPRTKEDPLSRAFAHYGARSKYTKNKLLKYWVEMNKKGNIHNFIIIFLKNIEANISKTIFF